MGTIYIYSLYIVYRVLSIYRVLPGFREFAVFEKSKRFFILFWMGVTERGSGPWQGPKYTHVFRDRRFCSQLCLIFNCLSFPLKKSYNNFGPQVFEIIVWTIVLFL